MTVVFLVALVVQFRTRRYVPADLLAHRRADQRRRHAAHRQPHRRARGAARLSTVVFSVALAVDVRRLVPRRAHAVDPLHRHRRREAFYWLAVLLTFALGTAAGDLVDEQFGVGYWATALIVALLIAAVAVSHLVFQANAVLTFWIAYILTRPLGASLGDGLSQPREDGGLGLGTTWTSLIFLVAIVANVGIPHRLGARPDRSAGRGRCVSWLQAIVLGIVEGLTEFLPVSSTGHLTIVEQLMGLSTDDAGVTAFTAIVQVGAILAVIGYFRRDIGRLVLGFLRRPAQPQRSPGTGLARGLRRDRRQRAHRGGRAADPRPGLRPAAQPLGRRVALIAWSAVMVAAERLGRQNRPESSVGLRDALVMGAFQCIALVPGVSRSGATISAGLFRGLDRVAATRISFLLSIPALLAAGGLEAVSEGGAVADAVGWGPTLLATLVSLVVGYASIAWLLRLVAGHPITVFVPYRIALGTALALALATGALAAT